MNPNLRIGCGEPEAKSMGSAQTRLIVLHGINKAVEVKIISRYSLHGMI